METRNGLGDLIRQARLRKGMTQEELAARLGVKANYISQWETGIRKWPQEYIRAIASVLGLSQVKMAIAAGVIDDPDTAIQQPMTISPGREAVLDVVEEMSEEERLTLADAGKLFLRLRRAQTVSRREEHALAIQ